MSYTRGWARCEKAVCMRTLRWKNRYMTGEGDVDRRNKKFVCCLNQLVEAAGQQEHCREMEHFIADLCAAAESQLQSGGERAEGMIAGFYPHLVESLPLTTYAGAACRQCGLCDLAMAKIAEHLKTSLECLQSPG